MITQVILMRSAAQGNAVKPYVSRDNNDIGPRFENKFEMSIS